MILVDTNVLIDILSADPIWYVRSAEALEKASARAPLAINDIVYAELSPFFDDIAALESRLRKIPVARALLPDLALFLAGQAFRHTAAEAGHDIQSCPTFLSARMRWSKGSPC